MDCNFDCLVKLILWPNWEEAKETKFTSNDKYMIEIIISSKRNVRDIYWYCKLKYLRTLSSI